MICNTSFSSTRAGRGSALQDSITEQILEFTGNDMPDGVSVQDVAAAVEFFLNNNMDCEYISTEHMMALASRALSASGAGSIALKIFVFGSGLVRPSEWIFSGEHDVWILDLHEMIVQEDPLTELLFFRCLFSVIEAISDVWDPTMGAGTLGLRNISSVINIISGANHPPDNRKKREFTSEIKNSCRAKLSSIMADRKWASIPDVLSVDIA